MVGQTAMSLNKNNNGVDGNRVMISTQCQLIFYSIQSRLGPID